MSEPAAFVMNTVWPVDIGRRDQRDEHGGRLKAGRDVLVKAARFPEVVLVDPHLHAGQQAREGGPKAIQEAVDPIAIVAMGVADENVVIEAENSYTFYFAVIAW